MPFREDKSIVYLIYIIVYLLWMREKVMICVVCVKYVHVVWAWERANIEIIWIRLTRYIYIRITIKLRFDYQKTVCDYIVLSDEVLKMLSFSVCSKQRISP